MMNEQRKATLDLVKKFIKICDEKEIWYSIDEQTMIGALRHGGFVPWHDRFEVMLKISGYRKFQRLFPNNIVDSFGDDGYKGFTMAFVGDNNDWKKPQPFIRIRLLVPTTVERFEKFTSIRWMIYRFLTNRKDNIKRAIDELHEMKKYQGYHLLTKRWPDNESHWIQSLSEERVEISFLNLKVKMIKEAPKIIDKWFGHNPLSAAQVVPKYWYVYPSPLRKKKEF